jgi:hypothetical protein
VIESKAFKKGKSHRATNIKSCQECRDLMVLDSTHGHRTGSEKIAAREKCQGAEISDRKFVYKWRLG